VPNQTVKPNSASSQEPKSHKAVANLEAIPTDVQNNLVAIAMLKGHVRQIRWAIARYQGKIESRMPGASRLAEDRELVSAICKFQSEAGRVLRCMNRVRDRRAARASQ